ncbi:MAG: Calx-beta domain-containing protein [Panacagrimonas sp.]
MRPLSLPREFRFSLFAAAVAALSAAPLAHAAPGDKLGPEFRVNTATTGGQGAPAVAHAANGDFVVAWADYSSNNTGVYYRRYRANGVAKDSQAVRVAAVTLADGPLTFQTNKVAPDVAVDDDGDFVITWLNYVGYSYYGYADSRIVFRRYSSAGTARDATPRQVRAGGGFSGLVPGVVAMDADGDFAIASSAFQYDGPGTGCSGTYGVRVTRYAASGTLLGSINVSEEDDTDPTEPCTSGAYAIAMESDGDFVVAYDFFVPDTYDSGVGVRRFNAAGTRRDLNFIVAAPDVDLDDIAVNSADIAVNSAGNFVVTWTELDSFINPTTGQVMARRYTGASPAGPAMRVNASNTGIHRNSKTGIANNGSFTVAWELLNSASTNSEVFRRSFAANGAASSGDVRVNTFTTRFQDDPVLAVNTDGSFVVAWESQNQDGSGDGVYAQWHAGGTPSAGPTVQFALAASSVNENIGQVRLSAVLSSPATADVTVPINVSGTATLNSDYRLPVSSIVIRAGQTQANFRVNVVNDNRREGNELVTLSMGMPSNASLGSTAAHRLTILAND